MGEHMRKALEIAAQCWCDTETSHIQMDPDLAEAFAKRFAKLMAEVERLRAIICDAIPYMKEVRTGMDDADWDTSEIDELIGLMKTEAGGAGDGN